MIARRRFITLGALRATLLAFALFVSAASAWAQQAQGNDLVVLINARNPTRRINRAQVRAMYLGQTSFWHGVVPVRLFAPSGSTAAGRAVFSGVLSMSAAEFAQHWQTRQLAGQGVAPPTFSNAQEVAQQIARAPGGIAVTVASDAWGVEGPNVRVIPLD